ncbi:uncharacterized protein METZ01_LOCUS391691, partial [marine metagenome]
VPGTPTIRHRQVSPPTESRPTGTTVRFFGFPETGAPRAGNQSQLPSSPVIRHHRSSEAPGGNQNPLCNTHTPTRGTRTFQMTKDETYDEASEIPAIRFKRV